MYILYRIGNCARCLYEHRRKPEYRMSREIRGYERQRDICIQLPGFTFSAKNHA